jgi:hypothetical protein
MAICRLPKRAAEPGESCFESWESTFACPSAALKSVHHASGQNYTLGSDGRVAYFEASANNVVEVDPPNTGSFIFHTNHPVANEDYSPEGTQEMSQPNLADSTRTRYQALRNHLAGYPGKKVIDLIQETLRSHDSQQCPICRPLHDKVSGFTYASTIMVEVADATCWTT